MNLIQAVICVIVRKLLYPIKENFCNYFLKKNDFHDTRTNLKFSLEIIASLLGAQCSLIIFTFVAIKH